MPSKRRVYEFLLWFFATAFRQDKKRSPLASDWGKPEEGKDQANMRELLSHTVKPFLGGNACNTFKKAVHHDLHKKEGSQIAPIGSENIKMLETLFSSHTFVG